MVNFEPKLGLIDENLIVHNFIHLNFNRILIFIEIRAAGSGIRGPLTANFKLKFDSID